MDQKQLYANRRTIFVASLAASLFPKHSLSGAVGEGASPLDAGISLPVEAVREASKAVGLAGAIWQDGRMIWQGQAGTRVSDQDDPVGPNDLWHLGSNTKAMTAALWARLVEQGRAKWEMKLADALAAARWDIDLHEGWRDRTVEDFMRHRAGLLDGPYVTEDWLRASLIDPRAMTEQRKSFVKSILEAAPGGALGTYVYGNANYILAGVLIEGLTGQAWEEVMRAELFAPLGITTGGFGAPQGVQPHGHIWEGETVTSVAPDGPMSDNPPVLGPAGTAHMGLADYGRFLTAMMEPGWLSQDSLARLLTPLAGETYALGWGAPGVRGWANGAAYVHNGSNTMWFATAVIAPARKVALVSVSNDGTRGGSACALMMTKMIEALPLQVK